MNISVIVTAYNIADYIGPCLDSLLVAAAGDHEIIVIDDGSSDATPEVLARYDDPRLRVITQSNGGPGKARNTGLDAARGDYILFVDGDDRGAPELIPQCLTHLRQHPEADLFVFDYIEVTPTEKNYQRCEADFWHAQNAPWNKLYRRTLIGDDRFDEDIWYEDLAMVRVWLARSAHTVRIPHALYNYANTRTGSIMNSIDTARFLDLPVAAERCVARIEADAKREGRRVESRLGPDWKRRFLTIEVFIRGTIQRPLGHDPTLRRRYVDDLLACLPDDDLPSIRWVRREIGFKVAVASLLLRHRLHVPADFLLYDLGRMKRRLLASLKQASNR